MTHLFSGSMKESTVAFSPRIGLEPTLLRRPDSARTGGGQQELRLSRRAFWDGPRAQRWKLRVSWSFGASGSLSILFLTFSLGKIVMTCPNTARGCC